MDKINLDEIKADLTALGKDEAEDVLKGAVNIVAKIPAMLISKYKWMIYILPVIPMVQDMALKAIDKIDGKEG